MNPFGFWNLVIKNGWDGQCFPNRWIGFRYWVRHRGLNVLGRVEDKLGDPNTWALLGGLALLLIACI